MCHRDEVGLVSISSYRPGTGIKERKTCRPRQVYQSAPVTRGRGTPFIKASRVAGFWLYDGDRRRFRDEPSNHDGRSEEHTSELQSLRHLVCRLLLEKKN